ncbi:hypothetical protein ACTMKN_11005 [Bacteroides pyogenes]|uniref:Uncharacterized protein n=3 Tax=Bacteroides pyogenes TaxID=310300 RepID=A0A5D3ETR3_9BACE|nr:hypothetical protein [Bacteroides pyogenes]GAE14616.1 hypothetical protein JCM6292_779 [Bacteroides pyogenes JCM 6292]MBR8725510.1 hypothetical protein [Bacteroides pyogenes]MBR8737709.1 hypothetical protein [Bacteroides pyogenes]MBR8753245.1 hypothetical protein [Bacteroides pyogenes]MBR8794667.1 hypothetical protein [Bacteroides pyogenes]
MKRVKITEDGFVWHVLTEAEAKQALGKVEVFALYDDDSESLIENEKDIETHIRRGGYVGIEVGFMDDNQN